MVVLLEGPELEFELEIDIAKEVLELNSKSQFEELVSEQRTKKVEQEQADFEPAQLAAGPIQDSHLQY